jgi:CRP-like cAMP-binding protein
MTSRINPDLEHLELLAALRTLAEAAGVDLPDVDMAQRAVRVIELKPRDFAFRERESHCFVYRVREGLLKQFYTTADGDDWIKSFTAEGDVFACPFALLRSQPTTFSAQAIEPSLVEQIDFKVIERLASESSEWQRLLRHAIEELALIKLQRERELLTLSAEALYREFARKQPKLTERLPQKDLAAYLGVTAVGLSRIVRRTRSASRSPVSARAEEASSDLQKTARAPPN